MDAKSSRPSGFNTKRRFVLQLSPEARKVMDDHMSALAVSARMTMRKPTVFAKIQRRSGYFECLRRHGKFDQAGSVRSFSWLQSRTQHVGVSQVEIGFEINE